MSEQVNHTSDREERVVYKDDHVTVIEIGRLKYGGFNKTLLQKKYWNKL